MHSFGGTTCQVEETARARALRQECGWAVQNQHGQCNWSEVRGRKIVAVRLDKARGDLDLDDSTSLGYHEESWLLLK